MAEASRAEQKACRPYSCLMGLRGRGRCVDSPRLHREWRTRNSRASFPSPELGTEGRPTAACSPCVARKGAARMNDEREYIGADSSLGARALSWVERPLEYASPPSPQGVALLRH